MVHPNRDRLSGWFGIGIGIGIGIGGGWEGRPQVRDPGVGESYCRIKCEEMREKE